MSQLLLLHDNLIVVHTVLQQHHSPIVWNRLYLLCSLIVWDFYFAGVVSLFVSTPPGHRTAEGKAQQKIRRTFTALQDGTGSPSGRGVKWFDRGRRRVEERGKEEREREREGWMGWSWEEEEAKRGFVHKPPLAWRKLREERWSGEWHGVHPNDEWWREEQRGGEALWESCRVITHTHEHTLITGSLCAWAPLKTAY